MLRLLRKAAHIVKKSVEVQRFERKIPSSVEKMSYSTSAVSFRSRPAAVNQGSQNAASQCSLALIAFS